ncbi:MAG: hypothetical protein Q9201_003560 [Fulgogasparrea decipioides]
MELEARYQQLLEHRIVALEKQMALMEPAKEDLAATTVSKTDAKVRNDEQSSIDTIKDIDDKVHPNSKPESSSRGQKIVMIWDDNEMEYIPEPPKTKDDETTQAKADPATEKEVLFKFIEYYRGTLGRVYESSRIDVYSKELIRILQESLGPYGDKFADEPEVSLQSPYQSIIYSWDKLLKRTAAPGRSEDPDLKPESERARESREGLAELLEYIRTSRELKDYFKNRNTDVAKQVVSYEYLWTLFPPATKVVASPFMGTQQLFLVDSIDKFGGTRDNDEQYWVVTCICLDFDTGFNRRVVYFRLKKFEDMKPITALDCYPTKFMEREADLLKSCEEQGKKFKTFCFALKGAAKLFSYCGRVTSSGIGLNMAQTPPRARLSSDSASSFWDPPSMSGTLRSFDNQSRNTTYVKGQVIVDCEAWNRWGPGHDIPNMGHMTAYPIDLNSWHTATIHQHSLHSIASKDFEDRCKEGKLLDEEYALLPPRVLGYIPVRRKFAQIAVKHLSPIENKDKDEVWKRDLILKDDKKKIIRTLVETHAQMADQRTPDLVEGKGNGLVILLHGPPGVGKSLTAECVAKATSKPLLTVGVADIGTDSKTVEGKLDKLFSLAAEWDAVLLIDEADVFMEQRGSTDSTLERNALVSVLLRVLEYYEGILILTTNRVLSFDVAVQSRINLAVMFHDLDEDQTQSIIKVHMAKRLHNFCDSDFEMFATLASAAPLNGRQIRNVINSAEAIVNRRESKLITLADIKIVLNHTKEFQQSLQDYTKNQRANNEAQGKKGR